MRVVEHVIVSNNTVENSTNRINSPTRITDFLLYRLLLIIHLNSTCPSATRVQGTTRCSTLVRNVFFLCRRPGQTHKRWVRTKKQLIFRIILF